MDHITRAQKKSGHLLQLISNPFPQIPQIVTGPVATLEHLD